jgi:hypothetical protein
MAEISKVYKFLIDQFGANDLVHTITTVDTKHIDKNIENIYPLVNLDLLDTEIEEQLVICNFKISILQQRDTRPVNYSDKMIGQNNLIDNLNETHSVATRFIKVLDNNNNSDNIELVSMTKLDKITGNRNNLDGFEFEISLSIPNEGLSC